MSIYDNDSVKNIKIIADGADITDYVVSGTFECENLMCSDKLKFGECNSAQAKFKTNQDLNLTGKTIVVKYGAGTQYENIGVYHVTYSYTASNSTTTNITMYDVIKYFDDNVASWYESNTYPMTLKQFRDSLCDYVGVEQISKTLVNDDMLLYKTIKPNKIKGTDLLYYIGEINGVFPHASRDGKVDWLSLGDSDSTYDISSTLIQGSDGFSCKSYNTNPIQRVAIRGEDGDVGVTIGTEGDIYYITANILVYGLVETQLRHIGQNLYSKIYGVTYTPANINIKTIPSLELGSRVSYDNKVFFVFSKKTSGLLFDEIECDGNEELEEDTSIETSIEQLKGKTNVLDRNIEQNRLAISDVEEGLTSEINQLSDSVTIKIQDLQNEIDGEIEIAYVDEQPTLTNYPAYDWTDMLCDDTYYASDTLYFHYSDESYKEHRRTMAYDEKESVTYRFVDKDNQWQWIVLANTEYSVILEQLSELRVTTDGIEAEVSQTREDLAGNYFTKTQTSSLVTQTASSITSEINSVKSNLSKNYSTTTTMNSKIDQRASSIEASVTKVETDLANNYPTTTTMNSKIDQRASSIEASVTKVETDLANNYSTTTKVGQMISAEDASIKQYVSKSYPTKGDVSAELELKLDADKLVSEFNAKANVITLTSDNFKLDKKGKITATAGDIGVWKIDTDGGLKATAEIDKYVCMQAKSKTADTSIMPDGIFITRMNGKEPDGVIVLSASQGYLNIHSISDGNEVFVNSYGLSVKTAKNVTSINATEVATTNVSASKVDTKTLNAEEISTPTITGGSDGLVITTNSSGGKINISGESIVTNKCQFYGTVYNASGGIVFVSDRNKKRDIQNLDNEKTADFIYSLNPVAFKYNEGTSGRYHHGLIAQDVKEAMGSDDWGLYVEDEGTKALRYDELITDLIATVQSQNERIIELERMIKKWQLTIQK